MYAVLELVTVTDEHTPAFSCSERNGELILVVYDDHLSPYSNKGTRERYGQCVMPKTHSRREDEKEGPSSLCKEAD